MKLMLALALISQTANADCTTQQVQDCPTCPWRQQTTCSAPSEPQGNRNLEQFNAGMNQFRDGARRYGEGVEAERRRSGH